MEFKKLGVLEPILKALAAKGYTQPTSIQQQAIPLILERKDLLGCAQTGTGKTAAFAIPILQHLLSQTENKPGKPAIKALVLAPTRELAIQVEESFANYGKFLPLRSAVIFGGVSQVPQVASIRKGIDILVATPGRLLDLVNQKLLSLGQVEFLVLDEADHMLDMGFIHDVKKIVQMVPQKRQTLLFSATMPAEIKKLADSLLKNPAYVESNRVSSAATLVKQSLFHVSKADKPSLLKHLLTETDINDALVFTRTKHGADKVAKHLNRSGIPAEAIHGNKSQNARQKALQNFKSRQTRILVATDIAARGIDINELSAVINFELPNIPETYIHRIGRTGRAGSEGNAFSFCDPDEREFLRDIQKLAGLNIPVVNSHPFAQAQRQDTPQTRMVPSGSRFMNPKTSWRNQDSQQRQRISIQKINQS